jgi:hypothetical protein
MSIKLGALGVSWMLCCGLSLLLLSLVDCDRDSYLRLFGYDRVGLMKRMTPPDDEVLAVRYAELLRQRRFEEIEEHLDPDIKNGEIRDTLGGMSQMFPTREPASMKTVDMSIIRTGDSSITSITVEYEFAPATMTTSGRADLLPRSWLLAQVVTRTRDGVKTIGGLHVMPISKPVEVSNEFTLLDKGSSQYAGLGLAIVISVFSLYVAVLCVQTKMGKTKWIWLIPIVVGACRLTVNWTTGQWSFSPLTFQVPPVMMFCTPYGPWLVHITAPLGAFAFLLLRKRLSSRVPR